MKRKFTRILTVMLIVMMLIPTFATFSVSADVGVTVTPNIDDIENLYALKKLDAAPSTDNKDDEATTEVGMLATEPFAVEQNQYIYVGPCPDPRIEANWRALDYIAYWYKSTGAYTSQKRFSELGNASSDGSYPNIVGEFPNGSVILKIKVNNRNYKFASLKVPSNYSDIMLVTVERPFTVEEYYAYAEREGWTINGVLLPMPPTFANEAPEGYEGLWNFFPRREEYNATFTQQEAIGEYKLSDYIPVKEGDVITMGAINAKEAKSILCVYDDEWNGSTYNEIRQYKRTDTGIDLVENIGYDFAIYSYTVPAGVSYVKVRVQLGVYNEGDILVTRNQPFTGAQLRQTLDVTELSDTAKEHPFYGKKALFIGDSISYGAYDTPTSYRSPSTSFARRFALATGLIPTNLSHSNVTVGKTTLRNVIWEYDLLKTALITKKNYDMVIFQGGINDALKNVPVGEALPADTDRNLLAEGNRLATFAGSLQLMFHDATTKWPDAELYYIANYKVVTDATSGKDMTAYYAQAKALCKIYGVHYIDLYKDAELYETFDYQNTELFANDMFTPTTAAYDLLFPAISRLFNETLESSETVLEQTTSAEAAPIQTTPTKMSAKEQASIDTNHILNEECDCEEATAWEAFWNSIANFFRRLFGQSEFCICVEAIKKKK